MPSPVKSATQGLDDPKQTFLDVVRPGNGDLSGSPFQDVSEEEAPVLVEMLDDDLVGVLRRIVRAGSAFERCPQLPEYGLMTFWAHGARCALVVSSVLSSLRADPQGGSKLFEDSPVPLGFSGDLAKLRCVLAFYHGSEYVFEPSERC